MRGQRNISPKTISEQIEETNSEIESYQEKLSEAKEKRKKLEELKKQEDIETMYKAVKASGKSIEDILHALAEQKPTE